MMRRTLLLTAAVLALAACGPAASSAPTPRVLTSATTGTTTVDLLTLAPLAVGPNSLFYRVTVDGQAVTQARLDQKPLMTMTTMQHGCPVSNPAHDADVNGLFKGTVVFTMPASAMETWDLGLSVLPQGAAGEVTVTFPTLAVADSTARKSITVGSETYIVTLGFDGAPRVGSNPYTVSVHTPENAMKMSWLPITDLVLVATPEMPSMGHGSSGNVSPTHTVDGLYSGTVNFSMAGDWVLHLDLRANDTSLGTLDFSISL